VSAEIRVFAYRMAPWTGADGTEYGSGAWACLLRRADDSGTESMLENMRKTYEVIEYVPKEEA